MKIARHFKAGMVAAENKKSRPGLGSLEKTKPSHKWLGYSQRRRRGIIVAYHLPRKFQLHQERHLPVLAHGHALRRRRFLPLLGERAGVREDVRTN